MTSRLNPNAGLDLAAIVAAADRLDAAQDAHAEAKAALGFNAARCDVCGNVRHLSWIGSHCTEYAADGVDEMCWGRFWPVMTLPVHNPVTGSRPLPFRAGKAAL